MLRNGPRLSRGLENELIMSGAPWTSSLCNAFSSPLLIWGETSNEKKCEKGRKVSLKRDCNGRRRIFLPSPTTYPNLAERDCVISWLFLCTEVQLTFHVMDFLNAFGKILWKDDSFGRASACYLPPGLPLRCAFGHRIPDLILGVCVTALRRWLCQASYFTSAFVTFVKRNKQNLPRIRSQPKVRFDVCQFNFNAPVFGFLLKFF